MGMSSFSRRKHSKWQRRYQLVIFIFWFFVGVSDIIFGKWWGPLWIIGSFIWLWRWYDMGGRFGLHNWFKKES
jgi:hypothetical protein